MIISKLTKICCIFASGWIAGQLLESWCWLTLSNEVNVFDAITLVVSAGLAIYVARTIEKGVQDKRSEKDIFCNKIEDLDRKLEKIEQMISNDGFSYKTLVATYQVLYKAYKRLEKPLIQTNPNASAKSKEIVGKLTSFKRLATYTNPHHDDNVIIENDKVTYSQVRHSILFRDIEDIRDELFNLTISVNSL